jgi:hypothetical protein
MHAACLLLAALKVEVLKLKYVSLRRRDELMAKHLKWHANQQLNQQMHFIS